MKKVLSLVLSLVMIFGIMAIAPSAFADDVVTLKFIALGDEGPNESRAVEAINEKLRADLNCQLEMEYISWSDWTTKYSLIFASGEDYDLVYTANWGSYYDNARKGAFYEITEENLQTYMPLTAAALTEGQKGCARVDGKLYMIPQTALGYYDDDTVWVVRGDLMDEFGMTEIASIDDVLTYWDNVLEKHPEMVPIDEGTADDGRQAMHLVYSFADEYGYKDNYQRTLACSGGENITRFIPAVVDFNDLSNIKLVDQDEVDEYYLSAFRKARELQEKGYWSADALTISDCDYNSFQVGRGASFEKFLGQCFTFARNYNAEHPEWDVRVYRFVDQPLLEQASTNNGMSIGANSKHPELAMQVLDLLGYEQSYLDLMTYGFEGEHYTLDENGAITTNGTWGGAAMQMGFMTTALRVEAGEDPKYTEYKNTLESTLPPFCQFVFNSSGLETEVAMVTQVGVKYLPILALGMTEDIEGTYAQFKAELEAAGANTILNAYVEQAQAQLG